MHVFIYVYMFVWSRFTLCLCFKHVKLLDSCFLSFCSAFSKFYVLGVYAYACE